MRRYFPAAARSAGAIFCLAVCWAGGVGAADAPIDNAATGNVAAGSGSVEAGNAEAGKALAVPCAACHGENGIAVLPGSANLAGQNEAYLLGQLEMIKSGKRVVPQMVGQLDARTPQELADLSAHYASMPPVVGQASDESLALGAQIYRGGIASKGVAACAACHSPTGSGNAPAGFPRLSGQQVEYVIAQLKAYREGHRETDEERGGMMRQVAVGLTDGEMAALANYILGLH